MANEEIKIAEEARPLVTGGECSLPVIAPTPSAPFDVIGRTPPWAESWTVGTGPFAPESEHAQLARLVAKYPDLARSLLPSPRPLYQGGETDER